MKKYFAEALGAFLLSFAVISSLHGSFPVATPVIAGLPLALVVYSIGWLSGAHINPAVTIGLWSIKKINTMTAIRYIVAQFVGAGIALLLGRYLGFNSQLVVANTGPVAFAEFIGTVFFTFGIASVVHEKSPAAVSGLVVGGSLLLGLSLASVASNAILNPAVAFGIGSFGWAYVLAPVAGSLVGMRLFKWLAV